MIHPERLGLEVTVCVDGQALTEYGTENDKIEHDDPDVVLHQNKWTITKYIEATTGKAFTIKLSAKRPYKLDAPNLAFEVNVDGNLIQAPLMNKAEFRNKSWSYEVNGVITYTDEGPAVKPMVFTKIQTTDSKRLRKARINEQKEMMSSIGQIEVRVTRDSAGRLSRKRNEGGFEETDYSLKIHEKALIKESKSHGTILGKEEQLEDSDDPWETEALDGVDFPIVIFVFKYRALGALRSLLVLPKTPEPEQIVVPASSAASVVKLENLSQSQKSQLAVYLQGLMGSANPVTLESPGNAKPMKREINDENEPGARRKRPKKMVGKITIDLTEDEPEVIELE